MSFELANASTIFQIYVNKVLRKFVNVIYMIDLNDSLIFNEDSTKYRRYI